MTPPKNVKTFEVPQKIMYDHIDKTERIEADPAKLKPLFEAQVDAINQKKFIRNRSRSYSY